jgi:hypothetical protein
MAETPPPGLAFEAGGLESRAGSCFSASLAMFYEQCIFHRFILGVAFSPLEITEEELDCPQPGQSGELGLGVKPL